MLGIHFVKATNSNKENITKRRRGLFDKHREWGKKTQNYTLLRSSSVVLSWELAVTLFCVNRTKFFSQIEWCGESGGLKQLLLLNYYVQKYFIGDGSWSSAIWPRCLKNNRTKSNFRACYLSLIKVTGNSVKMSQSVSQMYLNLLSFITFLFYFILAMFFVRTFLWCFVFVIKKWSQSGKLYFNLLCKRISWKSNKWLIVFGSLIQKFI